MGLRKLLAICGLTLPLCGCARQPEPILDEMAAIEHWLWKNADELVRLLEPPATDQEIADFERRTGVRLAPELAALYRLHNGESKDSAGIFGCMRMLPLQEAAELIELDNMAGKIAIFQTGGGDLHCMKSFDPKRPDTQLYDWWHERPEREDVIAPSITAFLSDFRNKLEHGQYIYRPDILKALIDKDDEL